MIGPRPRIWYGAGTGLRSQGWDCARTAVVHEAEALALGILEVDPEAPVALDEAAVRDAVCVEAAGPPVRASSPRDPQGRAGDAVRAPPLAADGPVEEGEVGSRRSQAVRVEQVIGAHVVLVDGLLDEAHAERLRVERMVARRIRRHGREMMDPGELHDALHV